MHNPGFFRLGFWTWNAEIALLIPISLSVLSEGLHMREHSDLPPWLHPDRKLAEETVALIVKCDVVVVTMENRLI
jgi:hypothetical protein